MRPMHAWPGEDDEDAPVVDRASLPARREGGSGRPGVRGISALAWSLMGLIFCLAVIAVGALVLQHLGLEGVRPVDPRDAYFNP